MGKNRRVNMYKAIRITVKMVRSGQISFITNSEFTSIGNVDSFKHYCSSTLASEAQMA